MKYKIKVFPEMDGNLRSTVLNLRLNAILELILVRFTPSLFVHYFSIRFTSWLRPVDTNDGPHIGVRVIISSLIILFH